MNEIPFMEKIYDALPEEERVIKLYSATLIKKDFIKIVFLIDGNVYQTDILPTLRNKLDIIIPTILPEGVSYAFEFKKTIISPDAVIKSINDYLYENSPSIFGYLGDKNIEMDYSGGEYVVTLPMEQYMAEYSEKIGLCESLMLALEKNYIEPLRIEIKLIPNLDNDLVVIKTKRKAYSEGLKLIDIKITETMIGSISKQPQYISAVPQKTANGVVICGKIRKKVEKKYKNKEGCFYILSINDTTGMITVKMFPRGRINTCCLQDLQEEDTVVIEGNMEFDSFSNAYNLIGRGLAKCVIDYSSISTEIEYRTEDEEYFTVKPQKYVEERQDNLFESVEEQVEQLLNKVYVVFDLETTGLDPLSDDIIEIGAVKIVDGIITETFSTLLDPKRQLTPFIIEKTNITDEMLVGQPLLKDVIGDFYKFTRGAILVAQNANFDISFISTHGKKYSYKFNNSYCDTLVMARQRLRLKKYNLSSICDALNVSLINAHRAMGDAMATAEVFKLLLSKKVL